MHPTSACTERETLLERYRAAARLYKEAMVSLAKVNPREFDEVYERAEGVRLLFERVQADLMEHLKSHACE